jgi:hypothetical protein
MSYASKTIIAFPAFAQTYPLLPYSTAALPPRVGVGAVCQGFRQFEWFFEKDIRGRDQGPRACTCRGSGERGRMHAEEGQALMIQIQLRSLEEAASWLRVGSKKV